MEEIGSYRYLIFTFIFFFGIILIVYLLKFRTKKKKRKKVTFQNKLNPELFLYSKLIDIELRTPKKAYKHLIKAYEDYLLKKYGVDDRLIKHYGLEKMIRLNEEDDTVSDYLIDKYRQIFSMKQKSNEDVIFYVKKFKYNFNKGNLKQWLMRKSG